VDEVLTLSARELARRIREGEASSVDVVEKHIARIEEVNPRLNAVVRDRFEQARLEAKQADDRARSEPEGDLPPLLGVPCTIKESISLQGMPWSSGVVARADVIAAADATPVARLKTAGVIALGVTNTPELTAWVSTFNNVYGRTCNAYDPDRTAGGSSGGEGAIIGAGGSPFGIGTDIGGSIRIPSFCNGVFGHKPTGGLVPGSGQFPSYEGAHCRFNTTGPITRRAEDLMPLLRLLAGPDGLDPGCKAMPLGDPEAVDIASLRVLVSEGDGRRPEVVPESRAAQQRAAYALAHRGAQVEPVRIRRLRGSSAIGGAMMIADRRGPLPPTLGDPRPVSLLREAALLALGRSDHTFPPLLGLAAVRVGLRFPKQIAKGAARGRALQNEVEALLGRDGVLLYPTARGPAPTHRKAHASHFRFTGIWNVLELPSTAVPLGLGEDGLPLGVQVVASRGCDHLTIAVAQELEAALGGWVPPGR
jgi:fatty acid amide hydrolase 2